MKEDYCFGDIDRIIDLYLDQFDLKNIKELNDFPRKLKALINQEPSAQKYTLYKENAVNYNTNENLINDKKKVIDTESSKPGYLSVNYGQVSDSNSLGGSRGAPPKSGIEKKYDSSPLLSTNKLK